MSPSDEAELRMLCALDYHFRQSSCVGKVHFSTRALALLSVQPGKRGYVKPYQCVFCQSWHVGSQWKRFPAKRTLIDRQLNSKREERA